MDRDDRLACPRCRTGHVRQDAVAWRCEGCRATFRALRGIPDLRTADDGYLPNEDDWAFAARLDADYDRLDFRGLLALYFELATDIPPAARAKQIAHIDSAPGRIRQALDALGASADAGPMLDLGCGSGSGLAALAAEGREVWGIDIAMRWLLVARKRLDEAGLALGRLICGCAERLPFRNRTFAAIVGGDVIEHVADQAATLSEAHRTLMPGGRLFLASPNRFSLAPEPHVGAIGVGYLPRSLMIPYVKLTTGRDFRAIRTLGWGEWRQLLHGSLFRTACIKAPALPQSDLDRFGPTKRRMAEVYNRVVASSAGQMTARAIGPLFHVTCERDPGGEPAKSPARHARSSSRAILPRSRRRVPPG